MLKKPAIIFGALLSVSFYSCSELGEKRTKSAKTEAEDDSIMATSGGLELTQPKLDPYVPAKIYQISLSYAKCDRDEKPYRDEKVIDIGEPDAPKKVNLEDGQSTAVAPSDSSDAAQGLPSSPILPRQCELKPIQVIKVPYVAGKLIRVKAPDGRLHVKIRILDGQISLLEGESIVQVLGGQGQTNIVLNPAGQQPGLIITTTVEGEVKPPPTEPQNPYPEIKDYLKYPGRFETRSAKLGMNAITVSNHAGVLDIAPVIVAAQPSDGIAFGEVKKGIKKQMPFSLDLYNVIFSKPGKYIIRVIDINTYDVKDSYLPANFPKRVTYHVFKVE